uniref:Uncharacterized protein n=1 Tax=Ixodes ricinus TaxID=34613 RepID=A0A6B0UY00_IXORI
MLCASSTYRYALYFFFRATISGSFTIEPSMLYTPSTMITIFFQGRWVRGCPPTMASLSFLSRSAMLLCLKTRMVAPDRRQPRMREAWLSSSLRMRQPFWARPGMLVELVAKPMPTVMQASTPRKRATRSSSSWWIASVPSSCRLLQVPLPYRRMDFSTSSTTGPEFSAKPR